MIPILFEKEEKVFATNGLGRLRSCLRCECTEERNGVYEVEFEYPVDGAHFDDIICGRIIGVEHDDTSDMQPFEIYSYSKPIDGKVTFKAFHISYKQSKMTVINGGPINNINNAFTLLSNATPSNPFTYWTDIESTAYMSGAEGAPKTVRQLLGGVEGSILDTYGGEYEWDKWAVKLWSSRGQVRDYTIRYGLNMLEYQDDTDYSETFNAVIPYWSGQDEYGNDLIIKGSIVSYGGAMYDNTTSCIPLDLTDKFESQPTAAALETEARAYLNANQPTIPQQSIKVDFIRLQDSEEFRNYSALQQCNLCDSVHVVFPRYGVDGYFKIVKTVYDVLLERYTSMELGTLSTGLSDAIGSSGNSTAINQPSGVIESGTDGIWTWRKWADGTAECWGQNTVANAAFAAWGGQYYTTVYSQPTFPAGLFISAPTMTVSKQSGADATIVFSGAVTNTAAGSVYLLRPANSSATTYVIGYYAVGRWK